MRENAYRAHCVVGPDFACAAPVVIRDGARRAVAAVKATQTSTAPVIDVRGLCVDYDSHRAGKRTTYRAVDHATLTVGDNEIVGVVGESGSGKTSLGMCIAGLVDSAEGDVRIRPRVNRNGARRARLDALADVQVVFQSPFESLDPRQKIDSGLNELRRIHPERTSWVSNEELFAKVGLGPQLLDRFPHEMSGGQAQRVSIARAMLLQPVAIIADEPTSALDVSVQARLLTLLASLRDSAQLSMLFISHDLGVVRQLCDRVYVMANSCIVESGSVADVFDDPQHEYTQRLLSYVPGRPGNVIAVRGDVR